MLDYQGKIEHPAFLKKSLPDGCKTKLFGSLTIRANIHTCFVPLINVYKTSLTIFNFTVKLKTCSMLPISTVPLGPWYTVAAYESVENNS